MGTQTGKRLGKEGAYAVLCCAICPSGLVPQTPKANASKTKRCDRAIGSNTSKRVLAYVEHTPGDELGQLSENEKQPLLSQQHICTCRQQTAESC